MTAATALDDLPDLTLVVRRDGRLQSWYGGRAVPALRQKLIDGHPWGEETAAVLARLAPCCISARSPVEARVQEDGVLYDVRMTPVAPGRAICTLRTVLAKNTDSTADETGVRSRPAVERRSFTRQLRDRLSRASLLDRPVALAILVVDGLPGIAESIGSRVADRVLDAALRRVSVEPETGELLGQLGENVLAFLLQSGQRDWIEARLEAVRAALCEPFEMDSLPIRLTCFIGVATLELETASPTKLIDRASAAAMEARRARASEPRFHSDTVRVRALERLDLARELRDAVERRQLGLRFTSRHDLLNGAHVAAITYLRWEHPLRGEVRPAEFLNIAEGTGFGAELSRCGLETLCQDFQGWTKGLPPRTRVSFGPLRDHVLEHDFFTGILRTIDENAVPPDRFELRIAERTFNARDPRGIERLHERGIRIVVDEVGRGMTSLGSLGRAPLWGLQLDRSFAAAPPADFAARTVCRAVGALAASLGLEAIATGVDDERRRDVLRELGYRYGTGDLYRHGSPDASTPSVSVSEV